MSKLEPYDKKLPYSYALGIFPALNLLEHRPDAAQRLLLHPDGMGNEGVEKLRARCRELGIREEQAERVLRRESKKDNCFAAIAFEKYEADLDPDAPHVVLHNISDGGNLGTALRACLGFGVRDVAVIRPSVDAFDPHVLRASMGALFAMRVCTYGSFEEYRGEYPSHALYPFMLTGAARLREAAGDHPANYALVFGNEASGLPEAFARLGTPVFIEQNDEIDSLNLAVSVSIGVYMFQRNA